jgi:hypothetical protein
MWLLDGSTTTYDETRALVRRLTRAVVRSIAKMLRVPHCGRNCYRECPGAVNGCVLDSVGSRVESERPRSESDDASGRALEARNCSFGPPVLSHDPDVYRTSRTVMGGQEKTPTWGRDRAGIESQERLEMPVTTLKPDSHIRIKYTVPRSGLIEYTVEAERPVDTYILDAEGLKEFYDAKADFIESYYGGFTNRKIHHQELRLPFRGSWYLLIKNANPTEPVAVRYEVEG